MRSNDYIAFSFNEKVARARTPPVRNCIIVCKKQVPHYLRATKAVGQLVDK
jgi:hypothetical protein